MFDFTKKYSIPFDLIEGGDKLIIGLSGGPDSVFLTYLLHSLREDKNLSLRAAHLNYKLRGQESDLDESFCRELAENLDIPIDVKICDLSPLKKSPGNIQAIAREERLSFYNHLLRQYGFDKIALGHTLDDNSETVLGNIIRGCGLSGLSGIAFRSGNIIRPLLKIAKAEITSLLDQNGISYRIDSSNLGTDYMRNKIRNILIPAIRDDFNPRFDQALFRLSRFADEVDEFLVAEAERFIDDHVRASLFKYAIIELGAFERLKPITRKYVLKNLVEGLSEQARGVVAIELIESALVLCESGTGTRADLGSGLMLEKDHGYLIVFKPAASISSQNVTIPGKMALQGYDLVLDSQVESRTPGSSNRTTDNWRVALDLDKLGTDLKIRRFEKGDYFQPLGMKSPKKLGDFFTDRKIPRALRPEIPLLVSDGEIVWIIGHEISDKCRIDDSTRTIVKLCVVDFVKNVE
jgi:tRNA(Ile)-lysidine synthase